MPTLDWVSREVDVRAAASVPYRLLEADASLAGGDGDAANMLIEGDNLEALKALLPYYTRRVKCIYIDPPFNTAGYVLLVMFSRGAIPKRIAPYGLLGSIGDGLFLRPDLPTKGRRAQTASGMAEGHRAAAQSVLDDVEHDGRLAGRRRRRRNVSNGCYGLLHRVPEVLSRF